MAKVEAIGGKALKLRMDGGRGFPDRTVLLPEQDHYDPDYDFHWLDHPVFFIEFKREQIGVVSVQQRKWKFMLNLLGFEVYTVDSDEQFDTILEEWK